MLTATLPPATAAQPTTVPSVQEPNLHGHMPALDALRGLAILVVTLYRFGGGSHDVARVQENLIPFLEVGERGVDLFFVLSGFLITGILFDAKQQSHYFLNFYARRTLRIFPLYYAVLFVALVLWPVEIPAQRYATWLWLYGANIVQANHGWCLGWLNHFWSLAVEEHFYLAWPLVIYCLSRTQAMRLCGALFVLSAMSRIAWAYTFRTSVAPEVCTLFRLDGLVAGAFIALAARGTGGLLSLVPTAHWLLPAMCVLLLPCAYKGTRLLTIPETLWALAAAAFLVQVVAAAPHTWLGRAGQSRFLHWLGKYSYGMYVYQSLLIPLLAVWITAPQLAEVCGNAFLGQAAYCAIMSLATALVAYLSWHMFEKHLLAWKHFFTATPANVK
jgi:peptidoglycan/LPS O-acetylase OafA/YrhL